MALHSLAKLGRAKKRRGRGIGSRGAKSGRGQKGQGSRAGSFIKAGFEGGQTPLYMRLPKGRGTKQRFKSQVTKPQTVPVKRLCCFIAGSIVGPVQMRNQGLISRRGKKVKIIGGDTVNHGLTVRAHLFTKGAKEAIEKAGGKVEIIS